MRPSWIEIDLAAVAGNARQLLEAVAPARLCAVVKADAYGHGDVPVAETVLAAGAHTLGVALVEEGIRLREAAIEAPILVLSEPDPSSIEQLKRWNLTPTVYTPALVEALEGMAESPTAVHLKVDTGMHRVGASPEEAERLAGAIAGSSNLRLEGVWTHLAVADEDQEFTAEQLAIFTRFTRGLSAEGIDPGLLHVANTPAVLARPDSHLDMVRVGLGLYGLRPRPGMGAEVELKPAMSVISQIVHTRRYDAGTRPSYGRRRPLPLDGWVGTIPIGYADGVPRQFGELGGQVLVGGRRCDLAGSVTMDQIVVDLGTQGAPYGEPVVLIGKSDEAQITADEWAALLGTINYEIVCRFGPRLPRRYLR